jgi:hypothetical protein
MIDQPLLIQIPPEVAEDLGSLKTFMEEERNRRVPAAAVWSLVATIAFSAASAVWMASATYHEVASLRATVDKWEPRLEELTKLGPLQDQIRLLQQQVVELQRGAGTPSTGGRLRGTPPAGQ